MQSILELSALASLIFSSTVVQLGVSTVPILRPCDEPHCPCQSSEIHPMPRYRITITSKDREAMLDLVRQHKVQVLDHGTRFTESAGYSVDAIAEPADIQKLESAGYAVQRHEDVDVLGRARRREVGRGDRYKPPGPR